MWREIRLWDFNRQEDEKVVRNGQTTGTVVHHPVLTTGAQ
jgi:hypothetical protein